MKSVQQHTVLFFRYLMILSGILYYFSLPLDIHFSEYKFLHHFQYETEYGSVKDVNAPEEEDAKHSNSIFELVFKETAENKESSTDSNGVAILKQGFNYTEVNSVRFSLDESFIYNEIKLLSDENSFVLKNSSTHHFLINLHPLAISIAINAP